MLVYASCINFHLFNYVFIYDSLPFYLSISLSNYISIYLCTYICIYLFIFIYVCIYIYIHSLFISIWNFYIHIYIYVCVSLRQSSRCAGGHSYPARFGWSVGPLIHWSVRWSSIGPSVHWFIFFLVCWLVDVSISCFIDWLVSSQVTRQVVS